MPVQPKDPKEGPNTAPDGQPYLYIYPQTKAQFGFDCPICQGATIPGKSFHYEEGSDQFFVTVCSANHGNAQIARHRDKASLQ